MTETLVIREPGDVVKIISRVLGFTPSDSLVVVPIGGDGPTARIDLGSPEGLAHALAPAVPAWSAVVVALYADDAQQARLLVENLDSILPGVTILATLRVADGCTYNPRAPEEPGVSYIAETTSDRDDLVAEAAGVTDVAVAENLAIDSYAAGNGARAWIYLDRAEALMGTRSEAMQGLAHALTNAVRPQSVEERDGTDQ